MECLEDLLLGKKEEKFATICRSDSSSVARHNTRWHKTPESQLCAIVPSTLPELNAVRNRCARPSKEGMVNVAATSDSNTTREESRVSTSFCSDTSVKTCSKDQQQTELNLKNKKRGKEDAVTTLPNLHAQTTLVAFKQPAEKSQTEKDLSLKNVMDAIAGLSLKVDHLGKEYATMKRFVFNGNEGSKEYLPVSRCIGAASIFL